MRVESKGYSASSKKTDRVHPDLLHVLLSYAFDDDFSSVIIGGVLHFRFFVFVAFTVDAVRKNNASWMN